MNIINKIMIWNYKGVSNRDFVLHVKQIVKKNMLNKLALIKTKVNVENAKNIFEVMNYKNLVYQKEKDYLEAFEWHGRMKI